jgi:hypothetical protein
MERHVTQIPLPGGSGNVPTGAMQFQDDLPGLFVRGDDAIMLASAIEQLQRQLAEHPDMIVASSLGRLRQYAEIVARDVVVRAE